MAESLAGSEQADRIEPSLNRSFLETIGKRNDLNISHGRQVAPSLTLSILRQMRAFGIAESPGRPSAPKREISGRSRLPSAGMPVTPVCQDGFAYPPEQLLGNQVVLVGVVLLTVQLLTPPPPDAIFTRYQFEIVVEVAAATPAENDSTIFRVFIDGRETGQIGGVWNAPSHG
jgi:hypothetical protein